MHASPSGFWIPTVWDRPVRLPLVGGIFDHLGANRIQGLARLLPDGTLDLSFVHQPGDGGTVDPTFPLLTTGASQSVYSLESLPDGRVYVAGFFEQIGGRPFKRLVRLQTDGSLDHTFKAPQPDGEVIEIKP